MCVASLPQTTPELTFIYTYYWIDGGTVKHFFNVVSAAGKRVLLGFTVTFTCSHQLQLFLRKPMTRGLMLLVFKGNVNEHFKHAMFMAYLATASDLLASLFYGLNLCANTVLQKSILNCNGAERGKKRQHNMYRLTESNSRLVRKMTAWAESCLTKFPFRFFLFTSVCPSSHIRFRIHATYCKYLNVPKHFWTILCPVFNQSLLIYKYQIDIFKSWCEKRQHFLSGCGTKHLKFFKAGYWIAVACNLSL